MYRCGQAYIPCDPQGFARWCQRNEVYCDILAHSDEFGAAMDELLHFGKEIAGLSNLERCMENKDFENCWELGTDVLIGAKLKALDKTFDALKLGLPKRTHRIPLHQVGGGLPLPGRTRGKIRAVEAAAPRPRPRTGDLRLSHPFDFDGRTVWDAGSSSGRLYEDMARAAAESIGLASGLVANDQGGCDVDAVVFQRFVTGLYDLYALAGNPVLSGMLRAVLVPSLVLLERTGGRLALRPADEDALQADRATAVRSMGVED
ncbi:DUF6086 family protein [Streptomyces rubiginosohelvolus]|uniref:DUF6086 family protein n=1 Tax=Streptomyces rubiginosohelvolus TaxID=67362 RepID=UPI0036DD4DE7